MAYSARTLTTELLRSDILTHSHKPSEIASSLETKLDKIRLYQGILLLQMAFLLLDCPAVLTERGNLRSNVVQRIYLNNNRYILKAVKRRISF